MKTLVLLLAFVICFSLFTGCSHDPIPALRDTQLSDEAVPLAAVPGSVAATDSTQPSTLPARLTAEEAKAIALKHAGFPPEQVRFLRADFDYDDGVPQYEVEFVANGWEYEYDIHAETGEILSFDKDR